MKTHYVIDGMHCNGCVSRVTRILRGVPGVTEAHVSLPGTAVIESARVIPAALLQAQLGKEGTYRVREGRLPLLERARTFAPLIVMFGIVLVWATIASYPWGHHALHDWMRHMMGGFFLLFGGLKVVNVTNFAKMYSGYDLLAARVPVWGCAYPFVEVGLGILYTLDLFAMPVNIVTAVLMTFGAIGIHRKLMRAEPQTCACLGGFFSVPLTWITVAENLLMAAMAVIMLIIH